MCIIPLGQTARGGSVYKNIGMVDTLSYQISDKAKILSFKKPLQNARTCVIVT